MHPVVVKYVGRSISRPHANFVLPKSKTRDAGCHASNRSFKTIVYRSDQIFTIWCKGWKWNQLATNVIKVFRPASVTVICLLLKISVSNATLHMTQAFALNAQSIAHNST